MFVLIGNIAASAGMIEALFDAISKWLTRARGGLYIAITLASAGFAAVSGSTVDNAAVFSRMILPQMERLGYHRPTSAGCIAAAGTFAVMIPPSLGFVLYGIMTGESIGKLFMARVVPGLLTAAAYIVAIAVITGMRPEWAPQGETNFSLSEKIRPLARRRSCERRAHPRCRSHPRYLAFCPARAGCSGRTACVSQSVNLASRDHVTEFDRHVGKLWLQTDLRTASMNCRRKERFAPRRSIGTPPSPYQITHVGCST